MAKQLDNFMKLLPYDFRKIIKGISLSYYDGDSVRRDDG